MPNPEPSNKIPPRAVPVLDRIIDLFAGAAGVLLMLIMFLVSYLVMMRYFFGRPPGWVVEICQYMIFVLTFLGAPWLLRKRGHVAVDILLSCLNQKANEVIAIFTSLMGMMISFFLAWYAGRSTWQHFVEDIPVIEILRIPKALLLAFIPVSFLLLGLEFLRQANDHRRDLKETAAKAQENLDHMKGG
ncbi:MAG: TRAP transporter small permease [Desulfobacteraceae bacterium]|nr:MAG: TRAP transporter small permease [Desulfobacteraceae bacterium]